MQWLTNEHLKNLLPCFSGRYLAWNSTHSLTSRTSPAVPDILREFNYNVAGQLASVTHKIGSATAMTLASYTYNDLGQQTAKSFPDITSGNQTYAYNIRGWLKTLNSAHTEIFKQTLYYESGTTANRWNGNISRIDWSGMTGAGKTRTYNYIYDNVNRLTTANYTASGETNWFNVNGIKYDANGNITHMIRRNQRTPTTFGEVDSLTYTYQANSNRLIQVRDANLTATYTSKDFKERSATAYSYDVNGNLAGNLDKQISTISYNHLNLPREVVFTTGAKLAYDYDAEGRKLTQKVYNTSGTLTKTQDYVGEAVFADGSLDYLMHEEGRVAYEGTAYQYEYNVKDHLGNIRQVLRNPTTQSFMATMQTGNSTEEEATFSQLSESRQLGPEHNVTVGGNQVAWLNADRGRIAGPGRTQPIYAGDSVTLRVHGKYADDNLTKINAGSYLTQSAKDRMVDGLSELAGSLQRSGSGNPIAILNLATIIASDLQNKEAPEAYLIYALYDQDSNRYEVGKQVLTKNAANQHEVLEENLYISEDGYLETFVVNETPEDVWFDDFTVLDTTSPIMQETHYDPWGLELTGIGFQYGGIKANKYLYNGKELLDDLNLNLYDYGARYFDPVIGRWTSPDPMASERSWVSPYNYVQNNPMLRIDPDGMLDDYYNRQGQFLYRDNQETDNIRIIDQGDFDNIQQRFLGDMYDNSKSNVGLLKALDSKSNSISGSGISAEAASNVFTDILDKAGFDVSKLHNGKISIDGGPNNRENFNDGSKLAYGQIASGQFKGQINPVTGDPYTYAGNAPDGTIKVTGMYNSKSGTPHLTTVSNVTSILGVHEYRGHAQMGLSHTPSDHRKIYMMQKNHPTFNQLTPSYRQHILDKLKK